MSDVSSTGILDVLAPPARLVADWTRTLGLQEVLATSEVALMACRGARYHHDGERYGGAAFCNLFLNEDRGLDLHFPATGHCITLARGTVVIFDTGHPHAVIDRSSSGFEVAAFPPGQGRNQVFLRWELPTEDVHVARAGGRLRHRSCRCLAAGG